MPIPNYDEIMLPMLRLLSDDKPWRAKAITERMAREFGLSGDEVSATYAGGQKIFAGRAGWARVYMKHAGLIQYPERGYARITERGLDVLNGSPAAIDKAFLMQFAEFREFQGQADAPMSGARPSAVGQAGRGEAPQEMTPQELMDAGYRELRAQAEQDLLSRVKSCSPQFFERLVVKLLVALGYGGSFEDAARAVGHSGDGGIDGIIKQDRLGFDTIYVQAKRWAGSVGAPVVQAFAGALQGKDAQKGVLVTTSGFTTAAVAFAESIGRRLVLVDGESLARLMFEANLGVSTVSRYEVKQPDSDFFEDEEQGAAVATV